MSFDEIIRSLSWQIKNRLPFPFPVFKPTVARQPRPASTGKRLAELQQTYALNQWDSVCTRQEWQENLYLLDLLDQLLGKQNHHQHCLDIGCKNGVYFPALANFTDSGWDGIELDAYRRYWNLASRRDHGRFMARPFGCRYLAGSLLDYQPDAPYDLITWLLPFVAEGPLTVWGLPRRFYQPVAMLQHAYELLAPNGTVLILNQGRWENSVQQRLFTATGINATSLGQVNSQFSPFQQSRFACRVQKAP